MKNLLNFIVRVAKRRVRSITRQAVFSTRACNLDGFRRGYFSIAVKRVSINWNAKLNDPKDLTKYGDSGDGKFSKNSEGGFVIPAPLEVDALMKKVPKGKLTTNNELRTALAKKHASPDNMLIATYVNCAPARRGRAADARGATCQRVAPPRSRAGPLVRPPSRARDGGADVPERREPAGCRPRIAGGRTGRPAGRRAG